MIYFGLFGKFRSPQWRALRRSLQGF